MSTFVAPDGATLAYDDLGRSDAPVLVCLAGGAAAHPRYLGDLGGLSDGQRLVVPHTRGVGGSAAAPGQDFWTAAADLEALREHLRLNRLRVLGHSAGTRLAIAWAARFPSSVERLVLVTPPPAWLVDTPSDRDALIEARRGEPAFDAAVAAGDPDTSSDETFNAWLQVVFPASYARWGPAEQEHAAAMWTSLAANRAFMAATPPADLHALLQQLAAPVLVVAGAQDVSTGLAPVVAVADLFPAGRAVVVDGCGHFPWVEQPAAWRAAVDPFLA